MKVAMYMPGLRPGSMSWTIYQDFAAGMRRAGMKFAILTDAAPDDGLANTDVEGLEAARAAAFVDRVAAPLTRTRTFAQHVSRLSRWLRRHGDTDVLYMEMTYPLAAAAQLAASISRWKGALVAAPMGEDFIVVEDAAYGFRRHLFPRRAIDRVMRRAAGIRCISPQVARYASAYSTPHRLIPLNVADATLEATAPPASAPSALVNRLGLSGSSLVLSLGRLHPFKGIHVLVEAMTAVPDADLVIAGPALTTRSHGDYGLFLEQLASKLGVARRVHLLGSVPHAEVSELMRVADVLVVPSLEESLNRVCVEAAAAGTPFIVTETTGVSELIGEPGVGQIVAARSAEALATAIRAVLSGSWRADSAATERFVRQFRSDLVAEHLARFIEEHVSGR